MSDVFFEADMHSPDHPRYWGRERFGAMFERVKVEWIEGGMAAGKTIRDVEREAIRRLKTERPL